MDISTGRCPNKKLDCDCNRVCAVLYGHEVRRLKEEAEKVIPGEHPLERETRHKQWTSFMRANAHKI